MSSLQVSLYSHNHLECTSEILGEFFEERAQEVTEGILERWVDKQHELQEKKTKQLSKALGYFVTSQKRQGFNQLKDNLEISRAAKLAKEVDQERERRIIAEASLSALQVELTEALDKISRFEKKESKRIEKKKKKIMKQRQQVTLYI